MAALCAGLRPIAGNPPRRKHQTQSKPPMISHKHKCIFIHVPKTAGSSIDDFLLHSTAGFHKFSRDDFQLDKLPPHSAGYQLNPWSLRHYPARYLKDRYKDYFKFCFVRNPWDLVVSSYFWWVQQTRMEFRQLQGKILDQMGFSNYVMSFYTDYVNELFHCGMGQCYWLLDDDNSSQCVNYVGRFENLQEDLDRVCEIIGLSPGRLPTRNATTHGPFHEYYNVTTAQLVQCKFSWDVKRFGYTINLNGCGPG